MNRLPVPRLAFLVATMLAPVLLAQDDAAKPAANGADAKAKIKAKGKANATGVQQKAFARIVIELDANGDETLQKSEVPESAHKQFEALLELMDTDGDGALGRGELQAAGGRIQAVLKAGGPPTPPKVDAGAKAKAENLPANDALAKPKERLKRMDANGDGKISRDEWAGPPPLFDRIDRDQDGFITEAEQEFAVVAMRRFMEAAGKKANFPRNPKIE